MHRFVHFVICMLAFSLTLNCMLYHGTNVLQKQFNFVLVFNKFANGFAHINFNCKDGHKFAKKFANVQTSTNFLSVEDSSTLHGNIRKFVISLWMHRLFPPKQKNCILFFKTLVFPQMYSFFGLFLFEKLLKTTSGTFK